MLSMPASAITSASPSFWQVMPLAPAATWSFASIGLLWVLICGRLATPAVSQAFCTLAMLRSTRSMSMTATGGPYSRAILAARGVVIAATPVLLSSLRGATRRSNPAFHGRNHGLLRGACHRARIRATRWLAMTSEKFWLRPVRFLHVTLQVPAICPRLPAILSALWSEHQRPGRISSDPSCRDRDRQDAAGV